jgi:hypothetical protein
LVERKKQTNTEKSRKKKRQEGRATPQSEFLSPKELRGKKQTGREKKKRKIKSRKKQEHFFSDREPNWETTYSLSSFSYDSRLPTLQAIHRPKHKTNSNKTIIHKIFREVRCFF